MLAKQEKIAFNAKCQICFCNWWSYLIIGERHYICFLPKLLQARGLRTTIQKFDPYINVDPGTLNPYEHGECYVTEDGAETDLDLGHYERFLNIKTSQVNNVTTGRIYQSVIEKKDEAIFWENGTSDPSYHKRN